MSSPSPFHKGHMEEILQDIGVEIDNLNLLGQFIMLAAVLVVASVIYMLYTKIIVKLILKATAKTDTKWDDYLLNIDVLNSLKHLIFPIILYFFTPLVFQGHPEALFYARKTILVWLIIVCVKLCLAVLDGLHIASTEETGLKHHPLNGLTQMLKLIAICVGVIIGISALLDKNPAVILTGLGASAAVLMLVFKDTILGLVAGVQLSVNKMLKTGDWITIPTRNINGIVKHVALTTVKVQNYDNTIVTVPPYVLISESFQNWNSMQESGARRVMRSINIDMNTIRFCTPDEMRRYEDNGWLDGMERSGDTEVNLRVFRHYLENYLVNHPRIVVNDDKKMFLMIRQLQPTPQGLPIELYFFSSFTAWKPYEYMQADIFDHTIAIIKEFGLKIYQAPSGTDLALIK